MEDIVIGIDLGTTNSCAAYYVNGQVKILENKDGGRKTPSVVHFAGKNKVVVGKYAKKMAIPKPETSVFEIKRLLGREIDDPYVQNNLRFFPFIVDHSSDHTVVLVKTAKETIRKTPAEICALILGKIKEDVETKLGYHVDKAVITVPAYFNVKQREATLEGANLAGFTVLKLLNEPTAAALSFYSQSTTDWPPKEYSLVYDLGGGTFDVAVLSRNSEKIEIICVAGDSHLGGQDFDNLIVDHVCNFLMVQYSFDARSDRRTMRRLHNICEEAKKLISSIEEAPIILEGVVKGHDVIEMKLTRSEFEAMAKDKFQKTIDIVDGCLKNYRISKNQIKEVILAGGSTRIPKIQQLLSKYFGGKTMNNQLNQDECVAQGAALQAAMLSQNPSQTISDVKISDVTPLSLGIGKLGDIMHFVIKRNIPIPVSKTAAFYNIENAQKRISFKIYEGERLNALKNHFLAELVITDLTPAPPGQCKVEVTMTVDTNGILKVSANERHKNNVKDLKIVYTRGYRSDRELENTLKDAEQNRKEDEEFICFAKEKAYLINYCNCVIYNLEHNELVNSHRELYELCKQVRKETKDMDVNRSHTVEYQMKRLTIQCDPVVAKYNFKFMPKGIDKK